MRVLVDTSILIDHLRGVAGATSFLAEVKSRGDELWSVIVVRTEVLAGMRRGEERKTKEVLAQLDWLDVDVELADAAGELARRYVKSRPGVDTVDYIVAASADALGADLATTNVKHFPMVAGLRAPY